jgi:hypothetical protein
MAALSSIAFKHIRSIIDRLCLKINAQDLVYYES